MEIAVLLTKPGVHTHLWCKGKDKEILYRDADRGDLAMGNARYIRNLVEGAMRKQAVRLAKEKI